MRQPSVFAAISVACVGFATLGCDAVYPEEAPQGTIIFPVAVALLPPQMPGDAAPYLLLANSDYDLRYRQGTLQSYSLDAILAAVDGCATPPCIDTVVTNYLADEVQIGPQVVSMAVSPRGDRVYLAVRSESDMTWVDVDRLTGALGCGGEDVPGEIEMCAASRRTTPIADSCSRTPTIGGDTVSVIAGDIGALTGDVADGMLDWTMLVHRNGRATLFVDVLSGGVPVPTRVHSLTGLPNDATNAALDAVNNIVWMTTTLPPNGAVPMRTPTRDIPLIGVAYDRASPTCSSAFAAGRVVVRGLDDGFDTRDVAFSEDGRFAHVLSRRPESLISIDTEGRPLSATESLVAEVLPVGFGPARLDIARVDGRELVAATCFDGRNVWLVDVETRDVLSIVAGFQGPQDVVIDSVRGLAYVADFRDSVLRVIDLRPIALGQPAELALQIGTVTPVRRL